MTPGSLRVRGTLLLVRVATVTWRADTSRLGSLLLSALLWLGAAPGTAYASPAPRVILIDRGSANLTRKIRAELADTELVIVSPAADESEQLDAAALDGGAGDALLEIVSDQSVQLYVSGSRAHDAYSRTLLSRAGEESFPWRVVEELRARLVELGFELPDSAPSVPAPPSVTAARSPTANGSAASVTDVAAPSYDVGYQIKLWGDAGLGGIFAAGGLGPAFAGVLGLRVQAGSNVSLRLAASLPLSNNGTTAREGEVDVSVKTFHVEAEYASQLGRGWVLSAGVGGGLVALGMETEAETPYVGRDRALTSGLYFVHFGCARELTDWLRLRASLAVGLSGPRPVLRFDEREVASWGPGFGMLTLSTELGWPLTGGHAR